MSGRHGRPEPRRGTAAKRGALAAGVGVAGLAALAAAPLIDGGPAGAAAVPSTTVTTTDSSTVTEPAPETTTTTSAPETSTTTTTTSAPETSTTSTITEPAPETSTTTTTTTTTTSDAETSEPEPTVTTTSATPQYGTQKYRVGVQRDPAGDIPDTINTVTSEAHVVETGSDGNVVDEFDCVTVDNSPEVATDATFCPGAEIFRRKAAIVPGFDFDFYVAQPGSTVTVTQTKAVDGLLTDTQTLTLGPCGTSGGDGGEVGRAAELPVCSPFSSTDLVFTDPGLPPKAVDDSATAEQNTPVQIDVAANDFSYGSNDTYSATVTGIDIAEQPKHGTVTVGSAGGSGSDAAQTMRIAAGAPTLTYTPNSGFSGTDPFRYTLRTKNGASTATVTVTVPGATTTTSAAPDTTAPDTTEPGSLDVDPFSTSRSPSSDDDLAATGTESAPLVGYGLALVGAGAGALAAGRHRRGSRRHRRAH